MTISRVFAAGVFWPRRSPRRMRWPVDETGRNSVRPSITPISTASSKFMRGHYTRCVGKDVSCGSVQPMSGPFDKELESITNAHTRDFARRLAHEVASLILRKLGIDRAALKKQAAA